LLLKEVAQEKNSELGFETEHDPGGGIENLGVAGGTGDIRDEGVLVAKVGRERGVVGIRKDGENGFLAEGFLAIGNELDGCALANGADEDVVGKPFSAFSMLKRSSWRVLRNPSTRGWMSESTAHFRQSSKSTS
jgi:hypothetical protein